MMVLIVSSAPAAWVFVALALSLTAYVAGIYVGRKRARRWRTAEHNQAAD
jgi:hypothetical protein